MRYSLLSRFGGAFWGAIVGNEVGFYVEECQSKEILPDLRGWYPGRSGLAAPRLAPAGKQAIAWTKELIEQRSSTLSEPLQSLSAAERVIATLPLTLFFHESDRRLEKALSTAGLNLQEGGAEALVFGLTIAQLLREQVDRETHLPQIIAYLKLVALPEAQVAPELLQNLERAQQLVQQRVALPAAVTALTPAGGLPSQAASALALYCLLQSPTDLPIALLRAAHTGYAPSLLCPLVGALAGAASGMTGFPPTWVVPSFSAQAASVWGIGGTELTELVDQLFAVWSGVYLPSRQKYATTAIAAPGLIRPR